MLMQPRLSWDTLNSVVPNLTYFITAPRGFLIYLATPQPLRRDARTFGHRLELGPDDGGMNVVIADGAGSKATIVTGDNVLAADDAGIALDAFGYQLRVLYQVGGVRNHARDEDLAGRDLRFFEDVILMLVARVRGLEGQSLRLDP